jgi:PTS system mannose-specific IIA component
MIGLVLVTHGNLAVEFKAAMEHVVGEQPCVETICIAAEDDMELRRADIAAAVKACNNGKGVIILTDMFGGTPSNLAISLLGPQVEVIAGVNLPMLIKLASVRKTANVEAAVQAAQDAGRKYIAVASRMLGEAA